MATNKKNKRKLEIEGTSLIRAKISLKKVME